LDPAGSLADLAMDAGAFPIRVSGRCASRRAAGPSRAGREVAARGGRAAPEGEAVLGQGAQTL